MQVKGEEDQALYATTFPMLESHAKRIMPAAMWGEIPGYKARYRHHYYQFWEFLAPSSIEAFVVHGDGLALLRQILMLRLPQRDNRDDPQLQDTIILNIYRLSHAAAIVKFPMKRNALS